VDFFGAAKSLGLICPADAAEAAELHRTRFARESWRDRIAAATKKLEALEQELRRGCCTRIHNSERNLIRAVERLRAAGPEASGPEVEALWKELKAAATWLEVDLPIYTLLSFGSAAERAKFVLKPDLRREMVRDIRWRGYVVTTDWKQVAVLS